MEKKKRNCVMKQKKEVKKQQHEVKKVVVEEEEKVSEDYCFVCKDGGTLIVCDHKDCVKAYHPDCVGLDESTEETDDPWICDWHSCLECKRSSKYQCYCCTNAVCQRCFEKVSFARVRGRKGFCNDCLHLALLGDEGMDVDSDGESVDFKNRETYEGLFKEYWDIIKEKEGLTLDDLHDADVQIKKGENAEVKPLKPQYESDKPVELEENREPLKPHYDHNSDDHDIERAVKPVIETNNKRPQKTSKRKKGSSRIESIGWASESLIEFLAAIGVDTNKELSQSDVSCLIHKYAKENKLFHPENKKIILCDARLRPLLKKIEISTYGIIDGIKAHFLQNLEESDDEGYSSGYDKKYATLPTKKQAWSKNMRSFQPYGSLMEKFGKEVIPEGPKKTETAAKLVNSDFATVVLQNMKLVYLKRGLVESLLENYETFESKVIGSFVKVKSEPIDPKHPYQLLPVTGIKKACGNENKIVLLQVSNLPNDISMCMLSNDDVSLEDCEGLQQKIETGLIPKLTVVEVEKKAKDLHEDITKYQEKEAKKQQHEVKKVGEEEEKVSEDYCFVCKDGGTLIVCDHKDCVKAYHSDCVGLDESTEETDDLWICDWHSCLECKRSSKYQCYCCTNAVCQSCFKKVSFARVRGSKGLCNDCVHLALLGDEGMDVDSDGETVDFKDRETYEGLFKEYWDIIKEKEGLTLEDLHNADVQIQKGENAKVKPLKPQYESDKSVELEENREPMLDDHDKRPKKTSKRKKGSSRIEYIGWASKSLIEFLAAIGVDTNKELSQSDVSSLIQKYAKENNLLHPEKRKIILCDARLRPLLKRRTISIYKINDSIEAHFSENLEQSEDDGYSSGYEEKYATVPTKRQAWWKSMGTFERKGPLMEKILEKEVIAEEPKKIETVTKIVYSDFATVVPQNMKLIYLKRGLVESLLENYETSESKVIGSFVKVKSEPVDPKYPYQLLPVTGIKKACGNENKIVLHVSNLPNDISMRMLSNEDISLEDCECLQQKIETGLIPKLTVVDLEKKAKDLHEDITKYAISRELSMLKYRIDQANEKGWRAELHEYRRRRELLQSEEERTRMLNELPRVIADVIEVKPDSEDLGSNNTSEISQDCKKIPA